MGIGSGRVAPSKRSHVRSQGCQGITYITPNSSLGHATNGQAIRDESGQCAAHRFQFASMKGTLNGFDPHLHHLHNVIQSDPHTGRLSWLHRNHHTPLPNPRKTRQTVLPTPPVFRSFKSPSKPSGMSCSVLSTGKVSEGSRGGSTSKTFDFQVQFDCEAARCLGQGPSVSDCGQTKRRTEDAPFSRTRRSLEEKTVPPEGGPQVRPSRESSGREVVRPVSGTVVWGLSRCQKGAPVP